MGSEKWNKNRLLKKHMQLSHEMEDGIYDDPNTNTHGRTFVAFMPDRILGPARAYISRKEVLLSLHNNDSQGSALIPSNRDKGDQRA
jgi:hypothetical protein